MSGISPDSQVMKSEGYPDIVPGLQVVAMEEAIIGNNNRLRKYEKLPSSCRTEINPQPRKSRSPGQKLVIANQWVSNCNGYKSHLIKAVPVFHD